MSLHKRDLQDEIIHRTGYTPCPNELFDALKGEPTAFMVWMYIFKQCEGWNPSYTKISSDLEISRNSAIKAVKILEERKLLVIHAGGQFNGVNETNKYELAPIKQWGVAQDLHQGDPNNLGGVVQNLHQGVVQNLNWNKELIRKDERAGGEEKIKTEKQEPVPEVKPTVKEVLRSWKRALPERPSFDARLSLLEDLFATLKKFSYKEDDLPRTFKDEALSSWVGPKSKDYAVKYSNEDYDKALSILSPEIQIVSATPVQQKMKIRKNESAVSGEMDIDTALEMVTDDDEIERIIAAHQKLLRGEDNE